MAQTAAMGPPLSPRETRRSGRRSAPSVSTSTSKSPDSPPPDSVPQPKEKPHRPSLTSSNSNGRNRRFKQEDIDDSVDEPKSAVSNGTIATHGNTNGRAKRKGKEKEKPIIIAGAIVDTAATKSKSKVVGEMLVDQPEEEEQGITRCVCGSTGEDDPDAGEFMVQCETCKVWQHGLCMGYESEDQLHDDDYYCEQCKPEQHQELLKKLSKRGRHSSANSHHNSATAASRLSRSHSPSSLLKPSKRRNTMNSRDAAFDESLKEIIEATAAEAAAIHDSRSVTSNGHVNGYVEPEDNAEAGPSSRKKRKRSDDDAIPKKGTRSASAASDRPAGFHGRDETPVTASGSKTAPIPVPTSKPTARNKRGARKVAAPEPALSIEGDEGAPPPSKRQALNSRAKAAAPARRAPPSTTSHITGSATHEHGTRRNQPNGVNGSNAYGNTSAEASRAYRNSHAYAVSQQPLFTSWNLPDYLSHLEPMLPSDTPRPLEVRGSGVGPGGRESVEKAVERGVKVKWPSKRMSVGDMNKRVRALVEWVGREQASAMDRGRRKDALVKALKKAEKGPDGGPCEIASMDAHMAFDGGIPVESTTPEKPHTRAMGLASALISLDSNYAGSMAQSSSMKEMERLMEELIGFQERFGPGAKNRERHGERRLTGV